MRLLLELLVAAALLTLAWQKSFKEWTGEVPVIGHHFTAEPQSSRKPKSNIATTASPTPPKSFTGHIFYSDETGKSYWLDAEGKRHYQP
jgi:hypothetical protein